MNVIDLRSDTVTRPDVAMREAMARAEVGDDGYGEDPTVRVLEQQVAARLGKEAGLFVPSGTMANQIAIGLAAGPGDEVIAEASSHCVNLEGGALSALWGAQPRLIVGRRGMFTAADVAAVMRPEDDHVPRPTLLCFENTHNRGGGSVWPLAQMQEVATFARGRGLAVHLDGARLFNAQAAAGVAASEWAACADTVSICLSKGLGAPVGSVLCGTADTVKRARRLRKRLGGGMRQAGILAAAGLHAIAHNVERLTEDHATARRLARGLVEAPGIALDVGSVETNMVFARFERGAAWVVPALRRAGVLCNAEGNDPQSVRFVTHLHIHPEDVDEAVHRVRQALG